MKQTGKLSLYLGGGRYHFEKKKNGFWDKKNIIFWLIYTHAKKRNKKNTGNVGLIKKFTCSDQLNLCKCVCACLSAMTELQLLEVFVKKKHNCFLKSCLL